MVAGVYSEDPATQLEVTTQFRKLLSIGRLDFLLLSSWWLILSSKNFFFSAIVGHENLQICCAERSPPIEEVIASGVVPRFVEFLTHADFPQLQVSFSFGWWMNLDLMVHIEISALVRCLDIFVHSKQKSIFVCDAVWGSMGINKYCIRHIWSYPCCDWSWGCANLCSTAQFTQWWCPWAGIYKTLNVSWLFKWSWASWAFFCSDFRLIWLVSLYTWSTKI